MNLPSRTVYKIIVSFATIYNYYFYMPEDSLPNENTIPLQAFLPYRLAVLAKSVGISLSKTYSEKFGISNQQWRVIFALARQANCSASYVVHHAALDKVQVSRAVAGLLQMALVERNADNADRRNSILNLTNKGWKIYEEIAPEALAFEAKLKDVLNDRETAELDLILSKLMDKATEL